MKLNVYIFVAGCLPMRVLHRERELKVDTVTRVLAVEREVTFFARRGLAAFGLLEKGRGVRLLRHPILFP